MRKLYPVSVSCGVLEVSASGYFNWLRRRESGHGGPARRHSDQALLAYMRAIHAEVKGEYGWPRMHKELLARGIRVGKDRVRKLTGIATGVLVLVLGLPWLLGQPSGRESPAGGLRRRWLLSGMAALLGLALVAAGWEWAARFEAGRLLADDATRALMRHTTWQAALAWWPWGSGPGTYANLYAVWQPPELGRYLIDMAHNDYLQLLMELGLAAVLLAAALMWLVAQRLRQGFATPAQADRGGRDMPALQKAAALGLLATALHAWVDYPFHIPANAMMACFLLGIFLKPPRQI